MKAALMTADGINCTARVVSARATASISAGVNHSYVVFVCKLSSTSIMCNLIYTGGERRASVEELLPFKSGLPSNSEVFKVPCDFSSLASLIHVVRESFSLCFV